MKFITIGFTAQLKKRVFIRIRLYKNYYLFVKTILYRMVSIYTYYMYTFVHKRFIYCALTIVYRLGIPKNKSFNGSYMTNKLHVGPIVM